MTLSERLEHADRLMFLRGLFNHVVTDGITLVAGKQYMYLAKYGVKARVATTDDIARVVAEVNRVINRTCIKDGCGRMFTLPVPLSGPWVSEYRRPFAERYCAEHAVSEVKFEPIIAIEEVSGK